MVRQRKITSYFRKTKRSSYAPYRKSKRRKYSGKRNRTYSRTYDNARVGATQRVKRQGPYRSMRYKPPVKATSHRSESKYIWDSSTSLPSTNNVGFIANQFGAAYKLQYAGAGTGTVTVANETNFDAYFISSQNAPYGMTKVFSKGVKVKIIMANQLESGAKIRISFCKLRNFMIGSLSGQWNSDVDRPIATRHWKVIKSESFIMEPATYTDMGAKGETNLEKNYYIPINKWVKTAAGDAATSGGSWQLTNYAPRDAIYLFIDTNDTNPSNGKVEFKMYINDYFCTVNADQT